MKRFKSTELSVGPNGYQGKFEGLFADAQISECLADHLEQLPELVKSYLQRAAILNENLVQALPTLRARAQLSVPSD